MPVRQLLFQAQPLNLRGWSSGDGLAGAYTTLAGAQVCGLASESLWGLLDDLLALGENKLDVAWVGHVWIDLKRAVRKCTSPPCEWPETYTTVSTVCAAALLWCLVDLNVLDNQVAGVQTLGVGVGLGVLEQVREELCRLDWPAGLGDTELLAYDTFVSVHVVHCISSFNASSHMAPHRS